MCLLENMWKRFGLSPPWKYWNVRDSRTVFDEYDFNYRDVPQPNNMVMHDALYDAAWDAYMLQRVSDPTLRNDMRAIKK